MLMTFSGNYFLKLWFMPFVATQHVTNRICQNLLAPINFVDSLLIEANICTEYVNHHAIIGLYFYSVIGISAELLILYFAIFL